MTDLNQLILGEELAFPDPRSALRGTHDGLVALGGDLSTERLLLAYRNGIFPWTSRPITWWSPDPRAILDLDQVHIPRSVAKLMRKELFEITINRDFAGVINACAKHRPGGTWISRSFVHAYCRLHEQGHAHSLECWKDGTLAGGIYGVAIGRFFAGESMFHRVDNASKVALAHLLQHLKGRQFELFDIQMVTPVTQQFGAMLIPRDEYLARLREAIRQEPKILRE